MAKCHSCFITYAKDSQHKQQQGTSKGLKNYSIILKNKPETRKVSGLLVLRPFTHGKRQFLCFALGIFFLKCRDKFLLNIRRHEFVSRELHAERTTSAGNTAESC